MKNLISVISIASLLMLSLTANAQEVESDKPMAETDFQYRKVENRAFKDGEFLKYKLAYGFMNAGEATLEVKKVKRKIQGREILHIVGRGYSISAFDWFFKVRDKYETYLDEEGIFPWLFVRRIEEGGYKKEQDYKFYQNQERVEHVQKELEYEVPHGVQDMISSFYYARTIDFTDAKKNQVYQFDSFVDGEVYPIKIKYVGTKNIRVNAGKFECMVFHPVVQEGRIFKKDDDVTVYITNDENKIPVLARAKILVGSVRMELIDYKNLANPIAKR
ncbi:MAG: DUF3108 domain-containing protein [Vicingaceae bacterium]|tara:strand:+ start:808 stop:1632 length:825 start_codon:yes stop_codon:yes gene_type:complete